MKREFKLEFFFISCISRWTLVSSSSGFSDTNPYPEAKYYDKYSYGTSTDYVATYKLSKLGDALKEVAEDVGYNWYGNNVNVTISSNPWHVRSGNSVNGFKSGVFYFSSGNGNSHKHSSSRFVFAP